MGGGQMLVGEESKNVEELVGSLNQIVRELGSALREAGQQQQQQQGEEQ
jgi:hypothetical protein